jgi:hypothetical protein
MNLPDNLDIKSLIASSPKIRESLAFLYSEVGRLTKSKEEAEKVLQQLLNNSPDRPKGWSMNSNACYYKEKYGKIVSHFLDEFVRTYPKNIFVASKDVKISRASIKPFINQAWMWLIEHDEKRGPHYKVLRANCDVIPVTAGIMLEWRDVVSPAMVALIRMDTAEGIEWRHKILEFCEMGKDGENLILTGLGLQESDTAWIKTAVADYRDIIILKINFAELTLFRSSQLAKFAV